jgi:hypothetical protein
LDASAEQFRESLLHQVKPSTLLRENKTALFGGLMSLFLGGKVLGKAGKFLGPKLKTGLFLKVFEAAWFWKILLSFGHLVAPAFFRTIQRLIRRPN